MRARKSTVDIGLGYWGKNLYRYRNPIYAIPPEPEVPPLYTEAPHDILEKDGDKFWLVRDLSSTAPYQGYGWAGTTYTSLVDDVFACIFAFPPSPYRYHAQDRPPWASAELWRARANLEIGVLNIATSTITFGFDPNPGHAGQIQYVDGLGYWWKTETGEVTHGGSIQMGMAGLKWETFPDASTAWAFVPIAGMGTFQTAAQSSLFKIDCTKYAKAYLANRNNAYLGFQDLIVPGEYVGEPTTESSLIGGLKDLFAATHGGEFDFTLAGDGKYYQTGSVTVTQIQWSGGGIYGGLIYPEWNPAAGTWSLPATARVSNGIVPRQTPL